MSTDPHTSAARYLRMSTLTMRCSPAFPKLAALLADYTNVWHRSGFSLQTNLKVYRASVLLMLLYACETWTLGPAQRSLTTSTVSLRKVMTIKWPDKIPNTAILIRAGIPSINTELVFLVSVLYWYSHKLDPKNISSADQTPG